MNRIKYLLFAFFLGFICIDGVFAMDIKLSKNSNDYVVGDNASVKLELNIDQDGVVIDSCNVKISFDNTIELQEVQALNSWTITNKNISDGMVDLTIKNYQRNLYGKINLVDLKYLVNDNSILNIDSAVCYDMSGTVLNDLIVDTNGTSITTVIPQDGLLKSLMINGQTLNPTFSPNVNSYSINNFTGNSLSLSYELFNDMYQGEVQVFVNDKLVTDLSNIVYELVSDNDVMLITIQVSNMSKYNIFVSGYSNNLNMQYLSSITVNGEELEIMPGKFDYEHVVGDDVKSVEVLSNLFDESMFGFGSSSNVPNVLNLNGKAVAVLNVVPLNDKTQPSATYTVTITNKSYNDSVGNPPTSDTSMYIVLGMLLLSLVGSMVLYQKNLNGYE